MWILHDSEKHMILSIWLLPIRCACVYVCVHYKGDKLFSVDHFSGKQPFVPLLLSPLASSYAHTSHTLSSITVIDGCSIFIPLCIEHYPSIWGGLRGGNARALLPVSICEDPASFPRFSKTPIRHNYSVGNLWHFSYCPWCYLSICYLLCVCATVK